MTSPTNISPEVLTVEEARRLLRVSRNCIYRAIARRQVHAVRVGRRLLVPKAALKRLLARSPGGPEGQQDATKGKEVGAIA